jgi:GT2 family glycosyltransferase
VVVVGYQSRPDLDECLRSVLDQDYAGDIEVVFVDNASTDGSANFVRTAFPTVNVVESGSNLGYAGGTNVGFRHAQGDYLVSLNPDTAVDRAFIRALVETARAHQDRALVTSCILFYDDPNTVNVDGNLVNFGLVAACRGLGEPRESHESEVSLASISGCAFLIPRSVLKQLGPFEDALHLYLEDTDLSLRALVAGYDCVNAPGSLVRHKYRLKMSPRKYYYMERNRWVVMMRVYRFPTILMLLPGLLVIEALTWIGAASLGWGHLLAKAKSYAGIAAMLPTVRRGRRQLRSLRQRTDQAVLARLQGPLPVAQLVPDGEAPQRALGIVNRLLSGYYWLVLRLVRW